MRDQIFVMFIPLEIGIENVAKMVVDLLYVKPHCP